MGSDIEDSHDLEVVPLDQPDEADLTDRPTRRLPFSVLTVVAVVVAGAAVAGGVISVRATHRSDNAHRHAPTAVPRTQFSTGQFLADAAALRGQGRLAVVSGDQLYLVDGVRGVVPQLGTGHNPAWSHDGRWLGFVRDNEVWIVDPTRPLRGQSLDALGNRFAWSPVADVMVTVSLDGLWIAKLGSLDSSFGGGGDSFALVATPGIRDFAWSPDGRSVAYVVAGLPHDRLFTVAAAGGAPHEVALGRSDDFGITLAGWTPDGGQLLYWDEPRHSPGLTVDGTLLLRVPLAGGPVSVLLRTLMVSSWLAPSPDGRHLLVVEGVGRNSWLNKQIFLCDFPVATCQDLPAPDESVRFDPAWSPNGDRIAFIQAPAIVNFESEGGGWDDKHALWVSAPDGSRARQVRGTEGAMFPQWSRDGRHALVVRNGGLRLVDVDAGSMTGIAGPISDAVGDRLPRTYGRYDWGAYFAWSR